MNSLKRIMLFPMMLALCALMVACTQPTSDAGGMQDEFEVAILAPRGGKATSRAPVSINTDPNVTKVYAKVFNSSRVHLPAVNNTESEITGVTKLSKNESGTWSATVKLATPASGTITFMIWAVNSSSEHLYSGDGNLVVGTNGNAITVTTEAGYSMGSMGPAGGYIFYDQGSYSDGWRFLEAAPHTWYSPAGDPQGCWSEVGTAVGVAAQGTAIGTGFDNSEAIIAQEGHTESAADLCRSYEGGGMTDWFLPSRDELDEMNSQKDTIGNFIADQYWSSSEYASVADYTAWFQLFDEESEPSGGGWKNSVLANSRGGIPDFAGNRIRPIRDF